MFVLAYLIFNYDPGTSDSAILNGVSITPKDQYQAHVRNNTAITLRSLTLTCSSGGDAQPTTSTTSLYPALKPGYGEDAYIGGNCKLMRVNESHQLW